MSINMDNSRSRTVAVGGVRLHRWTGSGPEGQLVILWHGYLATAYAWRAAAPALARSSLSVLVPDMRGYGDSDEPDGDDGCDAKVGEVAALVAEHVQAELLPG